MSDFAQNRSNSLALNDFHYRLTMTQKDETP